jgi:hypothetical protein
VEEEGAEGVDRQARQPPAMQGMQTRDHMGTPEADAKGEPREAPKQRVTRAEAVGTLRLETVER